jgi:pyrroloquinoline quinone (PQQ) biosynthesis protein C
MVELVKENNQKSEFELDSLKKYAFNHFFWENQLLIDFRDNKLVLDDLKIFFSQYYYYSKRFIQLLASMMVKCDIPELNRSLIENLWEESGEEDSSKSHPLLFRDFLKNALYIENVNDVKTHDFSKVFFNNYLNLCMNSSPLQCSAILAFATEGIIPKLYNIFRSNMLNLNIPENDLEFFTVHIECDDGHAESLEKIVKHYAKFDSEWEKTCKSAIDVALNLRDNFFEEVRLVF